MIPIKNVGVRGRVAGGLALVVLVACGGGDHPVGFTGPGSGVDGGTETDADTSAMSDGGGSVVLFNDDAGIPSDASDDCPQSAKLVYVTGEGSQLWSFYPPTLKFTLIGTMTCLSSPTHMTVDRQGTAWVVSAGQLYKASTSDASCAAVPSWTPHILDFSDFALTFVGTTNAPDNTLYVLSTSKLGKFDVTSGLVTTLGDSPTKNALGDMTSNGDGSLYFLYDTTMPTLYDLDAASGSVISKSVLMAMGGGAQALAFWGGDFYGFEDNVIYQFDPVMKTTTPRGSAPLTVTGAGQSTCVPKTPPPTN